MQLLTPTGLHYPITIARLLCVAEDEVKQNAPLFDYTYKSTVIEGTQDDKEGAPVERTFRSSFESYVEGTLTKWYLSPGALVTRPGALIADIEEPCKHEVQFGGMCANCGKDMTTVEYNTVQTDAARATINTVHGHTSLLVSEAEASKSDEEAKRRLLSARKLILVVDLDQTIIQATVEPTIADWQRDSTNPNHQALSDVKGFILAGDDHTYYIKPRPGLQAFLRAAHECYEMHIYTAARRNYAREVARLVDPDGTYFADRILSRDESGSATFKNLKRLFPVDTNMVVIIDDRGDVWQWSENLIRVRPFDFFVGVGDINSSFLPKQPTIDAGTVPITQAEIDKAQEPEPAKIDGQEIINKDTRQHTSDASLIEQLASISDDEDSGAFEKSTQEQDATLTAQATDKPLLQQQNLLDAADESSVAADEATKPDQIDLESPQRHSLLHNNDDELVYLQQNLETVHRSFFDTYEKSAASVKGSRVAELRPSSDHSDALPDVAKLMSKIKINVLAGLHLVFSGVVPLGTDLHCFWLVEWAISFGATVTENITKKTTHVIASPHRKTAKVRQAFKRSRRVDVVTLSWLEESISRWRRLDEAPYRIHGDIERRASRGERSGSSSAEQSDEENTTAADIDAENADAVGDLTVTTELQSHLPTISRKDSSPHEETKEDWASMDDELNDFLGSDIDDASESDIESVASTDSTRTPSSDLKRKRLGTDDTSDGEQSDTNSVQGSKLQRRKKKALERVSSLSQDVTPVEEGADTMSSKHAPVELRDQDDSDDFDDGALEAELEAELQRQEELDEAEK